MEEVNVSMGLGFKLVIIDTIPDNNGNFREGHLTLNGDMCDVDNSKLYKTDSGVINHFKNVIIPEYIKELREMINELSKKGK